jgi:hypothetical protein
LKGKGTRCRVKALGKRPKKSCQEDTMAKQLDPEQFEDVKEMMIYEVVLSEALVNLLDKKGLIKKAEILAEIKKIKAKTIEKKK